LLLVLRLPLTVDVETAPAQAMRLNNLEVAEDPPAHYLGAWAAKEAQIAFSAFYPNSAQLGEGDVISLAFSMTRRARWMSERVYGDDWNRGR
jgi:hypothetical protein